MFFEATLMDERREARREGRAEGIAEGRAEGIAEGRAEGRAEGIAEGRAEKGYEDIDRLVTEDIMDVKRACEVFGVSEKDYYAYKENLQSAE